MPNGTAGSQNTVPVSSGFFLPRYPKSAILRIIFWNPGFNLTKKPKRHGSAFPESPEKLHQPDEIKVRKAETPKLPISRQPTGSFGAQRAPGFMGSGMPNFSS